MRSKIRTKVKWGQRTENKKVQCQAVRWQLIALNRRAWQRRISKRQKNVLEVEKSDLWNDMDFKGGEVVQMKGRKKRFSELRGWKSLHYLAELERMICQQEKVKLQLVRKGRKSLEIHLKDIGQFIYNRSRVPKIQGEEVSRVANWNKVDLELILAICQYYILI